MIETEAETGISVISICNYDSYQRVALPIETESETQSETAARQQRDKREDNKTIEDRERESRAPARGESLLSRASSEITDAILAAGKREADDPCATGLLYAAQTWLNEGIPQDLILAFAAPVAHKPVSYISKTVRSQWIEHKAQPPPVASIATSQRNRGNKYADNRSLSSVARAAAERAAALAAADSLCDTDGRPPIRLISQRQGS
jgi:hypothetical protein